MDYVVHAIDKRVRLLILTVFQGDPVLTEALEQPLEGVRDSGRRSIIADHIA